MQFTQEQYKMAQKIDLVEYLKSQGYRLIKDGRAYRLQEHDSLVVKGNMWYWFSRDLGGTTLQFLTQYEKRSLTEAVNILANRFTASSIYSDFSDGKETNPYSRDGLAGQRDVSPDHVRNFHPPEKSDTCRRVFAYLNRIRGIDAEIISNLIEEGRIYESKVYRNCVFTGFDGDGVPRYASMRGTYQTGKYLNSRDNHPVQGDVSPYLRDGKKPYRKDIDGSDKSYGFCMNGGSDLGALDKTLIA